MHFTGFGTTTPMASRAMNGGFLTEYGYHLPPGGNVAAFVGASSLDDGYLNAGQRRLRASTLNEGLDRVNASACDTVMVLPGHTENIATADAMDNLKAGTKILGLGHGALRPKFTWTAAAASFLIDQSSVTLNNLWLELCAAGNGGVTVAAPITVSGAYAAITNCRIDFGADADDLVTKGIVTTAAADDFVFASNRCFGATAATCTTFLELVGTDRCQIVGNYISGATSAVAVGIVRALTTAFTDGYIGRNIIKNNLAASEEALTLISSCTGTLENNMLCVLDNASVAMDNDGDMTYTGDNYLSNTVGERGLVIGTVSA